MENIVSNFDFSEGITSWSQNSTSCRAYVVYDEISYIRGIKPYSGDTYAILTQRTETSHSLEQDITDKITPDTEYIVSAYVRVSDKLHDLTKVAATLKLVNINKFKKYHYIGRYDKFLFEKNCFPFIMIFSSFLKFTYIISISHQHSFACEGPAL
jgi:Carbohydrate binding domain